MIWIIGEYAERIDNADELLESFLEGFQDENAQVQLQLLTAIVKLFLKKPTDTQELVQQVRGEKEGYVKGGRVMFLEGFQDDNAQVQLQLLTAIVKLFLKKPTDTQELVQQVRGRGSGVF